MSSNKRDRSSLSESSSTEKPSKKTKVPKALEKVCSGQDLDNLNVIILTRKLDDTTDDEDEKNWKRCDYRVLKNIPNHDEDDEEDKDEDKVEAESERKEVERVVACCISEFNSGLDEDNGGEEKIRIGFLLENNSSIDVIFEISFNGVECVSKIVSRKSNYLVRDFRNAQKGFAQDFIVNKSKIAQDESEVVDHTLLEKLGAIDVIIKRAIYTRTGNSKNVDSSDAKSTGGPDLKIKESMTKTSAALLLNYGAVKSINKEPTILISRFFDVKEELIKLQIKYRNYIGYLVELARANVPIEQKPSTTNTEESAKSEVIEIESDEDDDEITESIPPPPSPPQQTTPVVLTPFKSQSLMSKVLKTVSQVEAMTTEDLIKFIKLIDENLFKAIKTPFTSEMIDGSVFLALSPPDLKDLGIKIGEQIKIKQIIQQVRENDP